MLDPSSACRGLNYSHSFHSPEGNISLTPQLNYTTNIVLELKAELVKIKTELKDLNNQLTVVHLSLINEVRHSEKASPKISTPFQHIPSKIQKTKIHFLYKR